ncbi:MAG: serine hydrolase domain-containing protein [Ramlibacter sp.]
MPVPLPRPQGISRRHLLLAAIAPVACTGGGDDIPVSGTEVPAFSALDIKLREVLRTLKIPGASMTVAKNGAIAYQRGFGWADRDAGQVVQPETRFRIASVSKPMTAVGVLRAFEADLPAALDRPVFGPGGLLTGPRYAQVKDQRFLTVRLRDLLQHTGGWDLDVYEPQYDLVNIARAMNVAAPAEAPDIIEYMLKNQELQIEPGTRSIYSNFGYNVLGRVLEEKTGMPFEKAMRQLVFGPAGMHTPAIGGDALSQRLPGESIYYDDPRWPAMPSQTGTGSGPQAYNAYHLQAMDAHGGWVMTSADMVRFADAVDGRSGVPAVLQPATVQRMTTRDPKIPGTAYGLGWVQNAGSWSHSGALTMGTHSYLERLDSGLTWAVVYNSLPADPALGLGGIAVTNAISIGEVRGVLLGAAG